MRFIFSISLTIAGCLLSAGCAASSRPVHYYTIQPAVAPPPANPATPDTTVLLVADIATPPALQDGRIHYRIGANEIGAYEYHRWVDRPGTIVRNSLIRALRASGKYRVVDANGAATGDYLVRGKLMEFGEVDGPSIQARISLQLDLVDRKTSRNVWDRMVERDEPVSSKDMSNVVQSIDRDLQHVVSDAAAQIDQFLASRR